MRLKGKKIILGISGSIAAYKSASLARLFVKEGAEVKVIMTKAATHFISKLTMSVLTKNEVYTDIFSEGSWHNHVELGLWADLMVVAPITASSLSKMASGNCDNMLMATYLSAKCPVFLAPAMDLDMWKHLSTKSNLAKLVSYGNTIINVGTGELASGLHGDGRMAEPEEILEIVADHLTASQDLQGNRVLLTAGPTYEHLDPVRFIGNYSSGKMGVALANELLSRGADVELILGPTNQSISHPNLKVHNVTSALEMNDLALQLFPDCTVAILAAAVADYRPETTADKKIKKKGDSLQISLVKNPDIAKALGEQKTKDQFTIGFALETNDAIANAKAKVAKKNFDFIVLNTLQDEGAGFGHNTNKVTIIDHTGKETAYDLKSKKLVAKDIINELTKRM